jgi:hypothetical protein
MEDRRLRLAVAPCPCGSTRLTRDCHENLLRPPSEDELFATIDRGLQLAPRLRDLISTGFPRSGRAMLTYRQAMDFEEIRTNRYWHHLNLPLVLHLAGSEDGVPGGKSLALKLLALLEAFAERFHGWPGAKGVMKPLWQQAWDSDDPCFWSVVASCYWALRSPDHVIGFEGPTGRDAKTADLVLQTPSGRFLVEIEIWHQVVGSSAAEFATALRRRFEEKALKKFPRFIAPEMGVIVQFVFVNELQLQILREHRELLEPVKINPEARWVGQLIGVVEARNESGSVRAPEFLDFNSAIRPPPPARV